MYIPKIIHLIWFGGNEYSPIVKQCINSWKKYAPDYDIKIWNEESFDIKSNSFTEEAYKVKKWAFVSDYVRLYALYNYGGVYIDSDVELLKPIEPILENEHAVTGYSGSEWIPAGFMAAEPKNVWIEELLKYYDNRHFILPDGSFDMKVNNVIITEISKKKFGFVSGDNFIKTGNVKIYPLKYFTPYCKYPINFQKEDIKNYLKHFKIDPCYSYCVHYGTATWVSNRNTIFYKVKHIIRRIFPERIIHFLERVYYKYHKWESKK